MEFECHICRKVFAKKVNLSMHMIIHSDRKDFKCGVCGKAFFTSSYLKRHMVIHSGRKDFKCVICERAFADRGTLRTHMIIHSGRKDFKCYVCGKEFNNNSNLRRHILILHSGRRDFKCDYCEKTFTLRAHLKGHLLIHTENRVFHCHLCEKKFSQERYLRDHIRNHSAEKTCKCEVCGKLFINNQGLKRHKETHINRRRRLSEKSLKPRMCSEQDKLHWSWDSEISLLELVKDRPIVWNQKDPLYHKIMIKKTNFEDIANVLKLQYSDLADVTGEHVWRKFKNLEMMFLKTLGNLHKTRDEDPNQRWPLFEAAMFLMPTMEDTSDQSSNFSFPAPLQTLSEVAGSVILQPDDSTSEEVVASVVLQPEGSTSEEVVENVVLQSDNTVNEEKSSAIASSSSVSTRSESPVEQSPKVQEIPSVERSPKLQRKRKKTKPFVPSTTLPKAGRQKRNKAQLEKLLSLVCKSEHEDEFLQLAKAWANELSQMDKEQLVFVKKGISDILFEGQMGTLTRHSIQINFIPSKESTTPSSPNNNVVSQSPNYAVAVNKGSMPNMNSVNQLPHYLGAINKVNTHNPTPPNPVNHQLPVPHYLDMSNVIVDGNIHAQMSHSHHAPPPHTIDQYWGHFLHE